MTGDLRESHASAWPWPASLDALSAAPRHHTLLLENDRVRVLETRIPSGELVPLHTHRWPSVLHVLSWSDFIRRDASGAVLLDSRTTGRRGSPPSVAGPEEPPPHSLENVRAAELLAKLVAHRLVAALALGKPAA